MCGTKSTSLSKRAEFHLVQYCQDFGVSSSLLYRVRKEVWLQNLPKYSFIFYEDLWDVVRLIKTEMPDIGEKMLKGVLESCNIIVPHRHVREALHKLIL